MINALDFSLPLILSFLKVSVLIVKMATEMVMKISRLMISRQLTVIITVTVREDVSIHSSVTATEMRMSTGLMVSGLTRMKSLMVNNTRGLRIDDLISYAIDDLICCASCISRHLYGSY